MVQTFVHTFSNSSLIYRHVTLPLCWRHLKDLYMCVCVRALLCVSLDTRAWLIRWWTLPLMLQPGVFEWDPSCAHYYTTVQINCCLQFLITSSSMQYRHTHVDSSCQMQYPSYSWIATVLSRSFPRFLSWFRLFVPFSTRLFCCLCDYVDL